MDEQDWKRVKGLKQLAHDGVTQITSFVETHHRHAAAKPFDILESIAPLAAPTKLVRWVHDGVLGIVYRSIHTVNEVTERADDWVMDRVAPTNVATDAGASEKRERPPETT